jgi:hypothetical protein
MCREQHTHAMRWEEKMRSLRYHSTQRKTSLKIGRFAVQRFFFPILNELLQHQHQYLLYDDKDSQKYRKNVSIKTNHRNLPISDYYCWQSSLPTIDQTRWGNERTVRERRERERLRCLRNLKRERETDKTPFGYSPTSFCCYYYHRRILFLSDYL